MSSGYHLRWYTQLKHPQYQKYVLMLNTYHFLNHVQQLFKKKHHMLEGIILYFALNVYSNTENKQYNYVFNLI